MATSGRTGVLLKSDASAVNMATPADGPSLGTAPRGHVDVNVVSFESVRLDAEFAHAAADEAEGGLGGFLHDVADLAGERDVAFAGIAGGFDVENFAADRGVGQAGDDAGRAGREPRSRGCIAAARESPARVRGVTVDVRRVSPRATCAATARQTAPIWRSSSRTPASWV